MADRRHKNMNWHVADESGHIYDDIKDGCSVAVLMDIRDLLQEVMSVIGCYNCKDIPNILRGIRKKLPTKKRKRRSK